MKVTFFQHCGFLVEHKDSCFLFDYYRGTLTDISAYEKLYVFVSHSHYDHYNSDIFLFRNKAKKVFYILSDDIEVKESETEGVNITRVKAGNEYVIDGCTIKTLISTDVGVAFAVSYKGKCFYHAGDLNWWVFPLQEAQRNEQVGFVYRNVIDSLGNMKFDLAFVPVDPTLLDGFYLGLDYFMKHTDTKKVFPMHFWGNFGIYKRLIALPQTKSYAEKIMNIDHFNQQWEIA